MCITPEAPEEQIGELAHPRLGVVGNPIAHSLSPLMQLAALQSAGLTGSYARILCPKEPGAFRRLVQRLLALNFRGINVTIPFKREARDVADRVDELSLLCGATNTLIFDKQGIVGCNTDGPGFAYALQQQFSARLPEQRMLLLGACGGAGTALAWQYVLVGGRHLVVANRPRPELDELVRKLRVHSPRCRIFPCSLLDPDALEEAAAASDLIVNATSLGLSPNDPSPIPPNLLKREHIVFDLITHSTQLQHLARDKGCRVCDGRSMLVGQGALSFHAWFGIHPDPAVMLAAIRTPPQSHAEPRLSQ